LRRFEPEATPALPAARPLQILLVEDSIEAVAGTGIIVNSVLPGPTESRGVGDFVNAFAASEGKSFEVFEGEFFEKGRSYFADQAFGTDICETCWLDFPTT